MTSAEVRPCWQAAGIWGDRSCPELAAHVHCRSCPTYLKAGRILLDREAPANYRHSLAAHEELRVPESRTGLRKLILFRVKDLWLALPSSCLVEILSPAPVTGIPFRRNPSFLGLVNIHGDLDLCFTLEHLLVSGMPSGELPEASPRIFRRFIVMKAGRGRWVFCVDEIHGTVGIDPVILEELPAGLSRLPSRLVEALFEFNGLTVKLIDANRLVCCFREALE